MKITTKNILTVLVILLATFSTIVSALAATDNSDSSIALTSLWMKNNQDALTVNQGENADLLVYVTSNADLSLWVDLLQKQTFVKNIISIEDVPANLDQSFFQTLSLETKDLAGDYNVRVHVMNKNGEAQAWLKLKVLASWPPPQDTDGDGIPDAQDNCPTTFNPDQKDSNNNGIGDACEAIQPVVNTAPVMNSINNQVVEEGKLLAFTVSATDKENQKLTYFVKHKKDYSAYDIKLDAFGLEWNFGDILSSVMEYIEAVTGNSWSPYLNSQTGEFKFTPDYDFVEHPNLERNVVLLFQAYDGEKYSAWKEAKIEVEDVNRNPEITTLVVPTTLALGQKGPFTADAKDADGDELNYAWNFGDKTTGSGKAQEKIFIVLGEYTVTLTVSDDFGGKAVQTKKILIVSGPAIVDGDNDGVPDAQDNCPTTFNPDQKDSNNNGIGDACEGIVPPPTDTDKDGVPDDKDNCPTIFNPDQKDSNNNGIGDACEAIQPEVITTTNLKISSIRMPEVISAGEPVPLRVNVINNGNVKMEDLRASVIAYDWDMKVSSGEFNLNPDDEFTIDLNLPTPDFVEPGNYLIKVTVGNDYEHYISYREIVVE